MGVCAHAGEPHTIWYWVDDPNDPVPAPYSIKFDDLAEAIEWVDNVLDTEVSPRLRWIKVFRSDNEIYTCFRWQNPEPLPIPPLPPLPSRSGFIGRFLKSTLGFAITVLTILTLYTWFLFYIFTNQPS